MLAFCNRQKACLQSPGGGGTGGAEELEARAAGRFSGSLLLVILFFCPDPYLLHCLLQKEMDKAWVKREMEKKKKFKWSSLVNASTNPDGKNMGLMHEPYLQCMLPFNRLKNRMSSIEIQCLRSSPVGQL